ncbi:MAG: tetratricopeptide repeat protein [Flavobacteriales bacterium]|nr:tetratricopeptide repeat protein [Flavobacteriales bacterium]
MRYCDWTSRIARSPWLERSAELEREFEAKDILAPTLNSLARAYRETGRPEEAEKILQEALSIGRELKDAPTEAATLAILVAWPWTAVKHRKRSPHCTNGLRVATDAAALTERGDNCQCLYLAHKAIGDGMTAVRYLEEYQVVQDSLENEKNARELTARDLLYTFGKEQLADSLRYAGERLQLESERTIESMRAGPEPQPCLGHRRWGVAAARGCRSLVHIRPEKKAGTP